MNEKELTEAGFKSYGRDNPIKPNAELFHRWERDKNGRKMFSISIHKYDYPDLIRTAWEASAQFITIDDQTVNLEMLDGFTLDEAVTYFHQFFDLMDCEYA